MGWGSHGVSPWISIAPSTNSRGGAPVGWLWGWMVGWIARSVARRGWARLLWCRWHVAGETSVAYERRGNGHHEGLEDSKKVKPQVESVIGKGCGHFIASLLGETELTFPFRNSKCSFPTSRAACKLNALQASPPPSNLELWLPLFSTVGTCIRQPGKLGGGGWWCKPTVGTCYALV